ncbi:MAG: hypothetical protein V1801_00390 [Candidatus Falkowbacteria bacterium]
MRSKEEWTERLIMPLYQNQFIQTLWNAAKEKNRNEGWILVSGAWAPWYFNIRPVGDAPELFHDICQAMAEMIMGYDDVDLLIGVEMAGVPLVGAVATTLFNMGRLQRFGYTRPTPAKGLTQDGVAKLLKSIDAGVSSYGEKDFVEARMKDGDRIGIIDDMATNLGSKIVARALILWQAKQFGLTVNCGRVFYFLNRGQDNREKGLNFAVESELALYPAKLFVDYVIEFNDAMPFLKKAMKSGEYDLITSYQANPGQFQGYENSLRDKAIAMAAKGL